MNFITFLCTPYFNMQLTSNYVALKAHLHYTRIGTARLKFGTCAGFYWHGTRKFLCVSFYPCRDPEHCWTNAVPYKMIPVCFDVRMHGTFFKIAEQKEAGSSSERFYLSDAKHHWASPEAIVYP